MREPLFWTAVLFGTGIAISGREGAGRFPWWLVGGLLALGLVAHLLGLRQKRVRLQGLAFVLLAAGLTAFGAYYYQLRYGKSNGAFLPELDGEHPVWVEAKALGLSQYREKYSRVLCRLLWMDSGSGRKAAPPGTGSFWFNYYDEKKIFPGDHFVALAKIRALHGFRNPGLPNSGARLRRSGIFFSGSQVEEFPILKIYSGRFRLLARLDEYRGRLKEEIERSGSRSSYLLLSLILGDASEVPPEVMKAFRDSGTAHILVVSGLNLSLVAGFCFSLLLIFFRLQPCLLKRADPYRLAGVLSIIPTSFYAVVSGLGIPVVRAWIMVMVLLTAIILRKVRDLLNTLGLAGLLIMFWDPAALFDPSFQLSFLAVGVLILYFPSVWKSAGGGRLREEAGLLRLEKKFPWALHRLALVAGAEYLYGLVLATTLIQLFTTPITCYFFSRVSLVGPLANLPTIPLCGFWVLPVGLMGLSLSFFSPAASARLLNLAGHGAGLMESMVRFFAGLPYASALVRPPTPLGLAGWFLVLAAVFSALKVRAEKQSTQSRLGRFLFPAFLLALGAGLLFSDIHAVRQSRPDPDEARITMLDVGQGQSLVLDLPGRRRVLMDGGGKLGALDLGEAVVARYLLGQGIRKLDAVVLSHPQEDHGAGLEYILSEFEVKEFWLSERSNALAQRLLEIAHGRKIKIRWISAAAEPVMLGGARFEFLNPEADQLNSESVNDSSLVIKMTCPGAVVLFPGEVGAKVEKNLVKQNPGRLASEILIAGHHGSNSSSSAEFLSAVAPRLVLISAGEGGSVKLPAPAALARLTKTGATIYRTDHQGGIVLSLRNGKFKILTSAAKRDNFAQ